MEELRYEGFIASYNIERGFGFVQSDHFDRPLWFHYTFIEGDENSKLYKLLNERQDVQNIRVTFVYGEDFRGLQAKQIQILGEFSKIERFLKSHESMEPNASDTFFRLITMSAIKFINEDGLLTQFAVQRVVKSAQKWNNLANLSEDWDPATRALLSSGVSPDIERLSSFSSSLANCLKFEPIGKADVISSIPCCIQHLERIQSPLKCFREAQNVVLVIMPDASVLRRALQKDPSQVTSSNTYMRLVVLLAENEKDIADLGSTNHKIVLLRHSTIIQGVVKDEEDLPRIIGRNLRDILPIERLQPYQVGSEYDETIFSGRASEREKILGDVSDNYAIYGGRKIGKTWFLKDICDWCKRREPYISTYAPFYVSLQSAESVPEAIEFIIEALEDAIGETLTAAKSPLIRMKNALRKLNKDTGKTVLLALDEIDDVIRMPGAEKLFGSLRQLQQTYPKTCKFIFAGYKALIYSFSDVASNNPFANWIGKNHFPLGCLNEEDLQSLIVIPLEWVGFRFDHHSIVKTIFGLTSGHPYYTQSLCYSIVNALSEKELNRLNPRKIENLASEEFFTEIFDIFHMNLTSLQLLIGKIFSEHDRPFMEQEIALALKTRYGLDISQKKVHEEMKILQACSVFFWTANGYLPVMQRINTEFFNTMDDEDLAINYLEEGG